MLPGKMNANHVHVKTYAVRVSSLIYIRSMTEAHISK
jgi:hypothetical protein